MSRTQAQNSIRNMLKNVDFEEVKYKPNGDAYLTGKRSVASEVYVNEVSQTLGKSASSRTSHMQITSWTFKAKISFMHEVDCNKAVDSFSHLPRFSLIDETTLQTKQIFRIRVSDIQYSHPPRRNATNGSVINLTIQIEPISGR